MKSQVAGFREGSGGTRWSMDTRDLWLLGLLAGAFLISRAAWLYWNAASSGYWEESYRWLVAHELMTGPSQPFLDYQADHYQGGSLVMSLLAIPFFRIFGESMISLKLSAVLVSTGILAMLYLLGRCFFGRVVAVVVGLAYLLGPPLVAFRGLVVMGSHGETIIFSLIMFFVFLGILADRWRRPSSWILLGFVSGLGIWFCYTTALSLLACALTWVVLRRLPKWKEVAWAALGGLAGLVPWVVYNLRYSFLGAVRVLEIFGLGDPIDKWESQGVFSKLVQLLSRDLPRGLVAPMSTDLSPAATLVIMVAFGTPLVLALALSLPRIASLFTSGGGRAGTPAPREERSAAELELVFIIYGLVFLAAFLLSSFTVDSDVGAWAYRLFTPPAVLLLFPAAVTFARALRRGKPMRVAAWAGCAITLAASGLGTVALATRVPEDRQILSPLRGYVVMGVLLHRKFENDLAPALAAVDRIADPVSRYVTLYGIGWGMEYRFEKSGTIESMRRAVAAMPAGARAGLIAGMGWAADTRGAEMRERARKGDPDGRYGRLVSRLDALSRFAEEERRRLEAAGQKIGR